MGHRRYILTGQCHIAKVFFSSTVLPVWSHVEVVHRDRIYHHCAMCGFKPAKREDLKSHVEAVHRDRNYHNCVMCGFKAPKICESNPLVKVQEMAISRRFKGPTDRRTTRASRRDRRRVKELKIINDYFCIILNRVNLY